MTAKNTGGDDLHYLRRQAEEKARAQSVRTGITAEALSSEEERQTLHELRVHQIEIEMQNEELRRAQVELDAVVVRYFDLYDLAPVGYCTLSENGLILEANLTAATLLGVARGDLANKPLTRFILQEDQDVYYLHRKQLLETGQPQSCELRMVKKDGTPFWTHLASVIFRNTAGAPLIRSVMGDITARKESEETIRRMRYQNELILNSAGEGIFGLDLQGKSTFVNPAAAKMLGYEVEDLLGKGSHGLIHHTRMDGSPYPEDECPIYATFRKGDVFHIEEDVFWRKDGTGFPVEYTCTPILEGGKLAGAVVTFLDISRRKAAEARQRREAGQLRERVKELNCLFSISDLFRKPGLVLAESFQGIVDRIPPAWQYPEIACARLVLENRKFQTGNYRLPPWKAAADILVNGQPKGCLEVGYLEAKDWGSEGPFLQEETHLLEEIAERTGEFIAQARAEEALREGEKRFRVLFEQAAVGVAQIETTTGRFMRINQRYGDIVGYSQEEMLSRTFQEITCPEDLSEDLRNMEELIAGKIREFSMEKRYRHKNGGLIWVNLTVSPMWAPGELPDYHIAVVQDITKRKQAEEERKQIEERVRGLSQQLLRSQEEERRRISRELHDVIGQNLSALKIGLEGPWMNRLEGFPEVEEKIKECSQVLRETIRGVRDLSHTLRPSSLEKLGLVKAVQHYCEDFSAQNRIRVDFRTAGIDDAVLDYDTRIALYRLIQEGLINIQKHAAATLASIRLVSSFPNIILRIEDNGQGFDVMKRQAEAIEEKRLGLSSMEERVILLQGKMKIDSQPGQGTRVFIEIPCQILPTGDPHGR